MATKGTGIPIGDSVFRIGDRVVYPNQGICRISGVSTLEIAGQTLEMVSLTREEDAATVRVPMAKVAGVGLRKVATALLIDEMFDYLASPGDDPQLDWKIRHRENADKMTGGGLFGTVEVLKGLHALTRIRPLPQKERELYDSARHLLVSETAAAMDIPLCTAEDNLDFALFPPPGMRRKGKELKLAIVPATGTVRAPKGEGDEDDDEDDEADAGADAEAAPLAVPKLKALKLAPPLEDEDVLALVGLVDEEELPTPKPGLPKPKAPPPPAKLATAPARAAPKLPPKPAPKKAAPRKAAHQPGAHQKPAPKRAPARNPAGAKKPAPKKGKK